MKKAENNIKETASVKPVVPDDHDGLGRKILAILASLVLFAGVCYAAKQSGQFPNSPAAAQISAPRKVNPVSGNQIVAVTKPLYIIKEDDFAYTNIQWGKALCPEIGDYIPEDVPEVEAMANNEVKISGNTVKITLPPLAGVTPVVFTDLQDGRLSPSSVPEEEIEIVYGFRDDITLYGTITDYGTTREMAPDCHIHYGKHSPDYDLNRWTNATVYYLNGTINRVQNNLRTDKGFNYGYKETVYHHDGMYMLQKQNMTSLYTYPGITQSGTVGIYNKEDEYIGSQSVEYQAFSRFQILYFPDEDLFQVDVILMGPGTATIDAADGQGNQGSESGEGDMIHRISMLSDYKMFRSVDDWYDYMGDNYITIYE